MTTSARLEWFSCSFLLVAWLLMVSMQSEKAFAQDMDNSGLNSSEDNGEDMGEDLPTLEMPAEDARSTEPGYTAEPAQPADQQSVQVPVEEVQDTSAEEVEEQSSVMIQPTQAQGASDEPEVIIEMGPPAESPSEPSDGESNEDTTATLDGVDVFGQRKDTTVSSSSYEVDLGNLQAIPRKNAAEQLMLAPGVLTANHGGEGHAHETFMRGFAAKEGQDIEFTLGGVPLNEVSNPHGHGYADLLFIPPELVMSVMIREGPFDPQQGDFAFAGSADYRLGVPERGSQIQYGYGRWNTQRTLFLLAPEEMNKESFAAFEYYDTDGYGPNRAAKRASALGQFAKDVPSLDFRFKLGVYGYMARFDQAGVVRQDDYQTGTMGFFDTYDTNQGGESNRILFTLDTEAGPEESRFHQVAFIGWRTMRLRTNFTGWLLDDLTDGEGNYVTTEQRGDGTENRYNVLMAGSRGDYTYKPYLMGHEQALSLGYALRFDQGDTSQRRVRSITAIPYKRVFDASFTILNIAGWSRLHLRPCHWFALKGGVRLDAFSFGVNDHNQPESDREGVRDPSQTSQSLGYAVNPRVTADFTLVDGLHLLGSYGQGTRSTEAMALSDNETTPFAKAHSGEGGLSYRYGQVGDAVAIRSQLSYVYTYITQDMLFSETAGRNVPIGASNRHAVLLGSRLGLGHWFDTLVNVGYAHATLERTGELIPYVPEWVVRLDSAVHGQLSDWSLGGVPVSGRLGLGFTYVPGRPLPLKQTGDPIYLLNLGGELRLYHVSLGLELRNLLNRSYRQSEYHYSSNFESPDAVPSQVAQRHFVAGEPLFIMGTLTWHVEDMVRGWLAPSDENTSTEAL